jgi:hypothetical protein
VHRGAKGAKNQTVKIATREIFDFIVETKHSHADRRRDTFAYHKGVECGVLRRGC